MGDNMTSWCQSPFLIYRSAEHTYKDAAKGRVIRSAAPCGRCDPCVAVRKQDWTGRLIAEGLSSKAVAFVTLTYKEKPDGFPYEHVQKMLKLLRMELWRKHKCGLRFFCAGERGDLKGRPHWHLLLFLDRPVSLGPWGIETHPGKKWKHWRHGWTTISNVDPELLAVKSRYLIKYAIKGHGRSDLPQARMSLKPGLGVPYLKAWARDCARKGVIPNGVYTLPGLKWERGFKAGRHVEFRLAACCRREVIEAWRSEWMLWRNEEPPATDWLLQYDDEAIWRRKLKTPVTYAPMREATICVAHKDAEAPVKIIARTIIVPGKWAAEIRIRAENGECRIFQQDDGATWFDGIPVENSVSEVLDIASGDVIRLDSWLRNIRGPEYRSPYVQNEETVAEKRKRWKIAVREYTKNQEIRLRAKHGTSRTAHSIYRKSYDPFADNGRSIGCEASTNEEFDPFTGEIFAPGENPANWSLADFGCYGCDE